MDWYKTKFSQTGARKQALGKKLKRGQLEDAYLLDELLLETLGFNESDARSVLRSLQGNGFTTWLSLLSIETPEEAIRIAGGDTSKGMRLLNCMLYYQNVAIAHTVGLGRLN